MSISDAAKYFHNGDYSQAAELLKKNLYNASPNIQHNYAISEYYTKGSPRSHTKLLIKQLTQLKSLYPNDISKHSALSFNLAELYLNRHQYSKSVKIFKELINSPQDIPVNIYFRTCLRLFSIYVHHDMIENAQLIYRKLLQMTRTQILQLDKSAGAPGDISSSLKYEYWLHIIGCHLYLLDSSIQEAYKELAKAIDLIKKKASSSGNNSFNITHRIRILFLKSYQDFISGNILTSKSQLFQINSYYKKLVKNKDKNKNSNFEDVIAFLNNMSCIYSILNETGSACGLIHRALSLHASYINNIALYSSDHQISYLCYNNGLYLQKLKQYNRAIDSFLCCLPVLQSKARLWLRLGQCILAIWEEPNGKDYKDIDGINSLTKDIIPASSTRRGDLYLLPTGRKPLLYTVADGTSNTTGSVDHGLKFHLRNDNDYSYPYKLYQNKQNIAQLKRKKRWNKRKQKQKEFNNKTDVIISKLDNYKIGDFNDVSHDDNNNDNNDKDNNDIRTNRLYSKEKAHTLREKKEDLISRQFQIRELDDLHIAIEWLKNSILLFEKMESNLGLCDYSGEMSSHLHISYCYLKLKAWNFAYNHAEKTLNLYAKSEQQKLNRNNNNNNNNNITSSSHTTFLARMYAAEALLHLNRFNEAMTHLNPSNFPHIQKQQEQINNSNNNGNTTSSNTPKSTKSNNSNNNNNNNKKEEKTNLNNSAPNINIKNVQNNDNNNDNKSDNNDINNNKTNVKNIGNVGNNLKTKIKMKKFNESYRIEAENECYLTILVNLATTYICKGNLDNAHKFIYKALTINSSYYPALRMLIYLHMRVGNNDQAIKILKYRRPIPVKKLMNTTKTKI